ncbi:hypothetical protein [Hyphococcus luteus]|nr:hypothetical protein [Marinicaulis flavus]
MVKLENNGDISSPSPEIKDFDLSPRGRDNDSALTGSENNG